MESNPKYINRIFSCEVINNILVLSFDLKQGAKLITSDFLFKFNFENFQLSNFYQSFPFEDNKGKLRIASYYYEILIDSANYQDVIESGGYYNLTIPLKSI